jgi:predicted dehydrogenase
MQAAIVGAGGAGLLHALAFRSHGVAVTHVFDPDPARARNLASLCGARAVPSLDAIADGEASCVSICSPPRWHVAQAERCARDGRAVFVEKPVAVSAAELTRLRAVAGCVPVVQWRAGRAIRGLRAALGEFLLGPSPSMCIDVALRRSASYFAAGPGSREGWGAGALLSVGIHAVDAACFALDRAVLRVHGALGPSDAGALETTAGVLVAFSGGATGVVRVTFDAGDDDVRIAFAGAGVSATLSGGEVDPTAGRVEWKTADPKKRARLEAIERAAGGHASAPLLVPYLGDAVSALRAGAVPGSCAALPSIEDVASAHAIALRAGAAHTDSPAASAYSPCARRSAATACSCACCIL